MNKNDMKGLVVAGLLFFVLLIILAFVVPFAYHYVTTGPDDEDVGTIEDVPGGGIVAGLGFVIGLIVVVIAAAVKVLDLI